MSPTTFQLIVIYYAVTMVPGGQVSSCKSYSGRERFQYDDGKAFSSLKSSKKEEKKLEKKKNSVGHLDMAFFSQF